MKICTKCKEEKVLEKFSSRGPRSNSSQSWCKECSRIAGQKYRLLHPEVRKAYYESHRAEILLKATAYKKEHPLESARNARKWRQSNPDKFREVMRAYRQTESGKIVQRIKQHRRRFGAGGSFTAQEWADKLSLYEGKCCYCGAPWEQMDHLIPLSRGGSNNIDNLVPACRSCNRDKGSKTLGEYLTLR